MSDKTLDALWDRYRRMRVDRTKCAAETVRTYDVYIRPSLGQRTVSRIKLADLENLHNEMKETPYQANRVITLLRPMFKYAEAIEWVALGVNPAAHVRTFPERKRRRHMTPAEAPRISRAILDREASSPEACAFLWLLIFTGARPSEIKAAKWKDLVASKLELTEHKSERKGTKRVVMLPKAAMDKLLQLVPRGHPDSKIIPIVSPQWIWRCIREEARVRDLRVYDLRHTFGSYALENGFSLAQIGEALDHVNPSTTKIYAEMNTRAREKIAADTSTAILRDMNVVEVEVPDALT